MGSKNSRGSFERLLVWQKSKQVAVEVCRAIAQCRDWGLRDQLTRSAISVPSNISEGAERGSAKEFALFLSYAKGSAGEMRTQLMIASELDYIEKSRADSLIKESREVSCMIHALRNSLQTSSSAKRGSEVEVES